MDIKPIPGAIILNLFGARLLTEFARRWTQQK